MAAKKKSKPAKSKATSKAKPAAKKPVNKSAFVRSLPRTMPGAEVVTKAKAQGITISLAYVYGIRAKSKVSRRKKTTAKVANGESAAAAVTPKHGPGRPRKIANGNGHVTTDAGNGLVGIIEAIVEQKVQELLRSKLGSLFSS